MAGQGRQGGTETKLLIIQIPNPQSLSSIPILNPYPQSPNIYNIYVFKII